VEVVALGSVQNFVRSGRGVDPYFLLPPPDIWSFGWVVESMIFSEERHRRIAPCVYG
jgi:hypothetical protein